MYICQIEIAFTCCAINMKCQLSPPPLILVGGAGGERCLRGWRWLAFLANDLSLSILV